MAKQAILHPFDTVKTRLQAATVLPLDRRQLFQDLPPGHRVGGPGAPRYRGLLPTLLSGTPGSASFFAAKEATQSMLREAPQALRTSSGVLVGVLCAKAGGAPRAGACEAIKTPFDVAETKAMATVAKGEAQGGS